MKLEKTLQKWLRSLRKRIWFLRPKPVSRHSILARIRGVSAESDESPKQMINLKEVFARHEVTPKGVIHVGAHEAAELEEYLSLGFAKIFYVEANPKLIPALRAKASRYPGRVFVAHAAASDSDGTVRLRVTSMDQSSSILPLGKHKEIYPSIREVGQVEVRSRCLDTLLAEEGLDPKDFNFLNLDIQGAELMALRGATKLLTTITAVNSEINLQELYKGAALLGEVEEFMEKKGFSRASMVTPWHPSWGDAFYVRKPVVTMSSFGSNGRFANQLFQYLFLSLVARRQGAIVQTSPWVGQELFGFDDPSPVRPFPEWREPVDMLSVADSFRGCVWTQHFREKAPVFNSVDYWGYFMGDTADLAPDKDYIRSLFCFVPEFREVAGSKLAALCGTRRLLAVHLRRGDYGYGHFFRAPCSWYEKWVRGLGLNPSEWLIYVCSEEPATYRGRFAGFCTADAGDLGVSSDLAAYMDFYVMTQADQVLVANSSFSFMAAMLNEKASVFARPCAQRQALVEFDPWDAPVLLRHTPTAEEHRSFADQD
jgi:FkbM family methyltransferase